MNVDAIADAVVLELNSGQFLYSFTAEHKKDPQFSVSEGELDKLKVTVIDIPGATVTRASRGKHFYDYTVHVLSNVKVNEDDYKPGTLREFVEGMIDHFRNLGELDVADADGPVVVLKVVEDVMYELPEHLREKRVFTGAFGLVCRITR